MAEEARNTSSLLKQSINACWIGTFISIYQCFLHIDLSNYLSIYRIYRHSILFDLSFPFVTSIISIIIFNYHIHLSYPSIISIYLSIIVLSIIISCRALQSEGFHITYLPVKANGIIDLDEFRKELKPETVLVSIMGVNNEIGVIQPLKEIGKV